MRLPPEVTLSFLIIAAVTAGYLVVAAEGPPAASGLIGHGLGVAGFIAMAVGTGGYAWRKRRSGPGPMQRWLQAHVVTGLVGPYLVLLHTGFAFRGLAGAAFLLLAVVVVSGLAGRFAYTSVLKPPPAYAVPADQRWRAAVAFTPEITEAARESIAADRDVLVQQARSAARQRRALALWWLLHVPMAIAMFALAVVHILAALYYATLLR